MRPPFGPRMPRAPRPRGRHDELTYAEVQEVFRLAEEAAQAEGGGVTADHLALGVWRAGGTSGANVLRDLGMTEEILAQRPTGVPPQRGWGFPIQPIIQAAGEEAWQLGSRLTRSGHILLGLVAAGQGALSGWLAAKGITLDALRERVRAAAALTPTPDRAPPPTPGPAEGQALFTVEEAAQFLGIHHQTIRGYIKNAKLPAYRVAGEKVIRIKRDDLMALLEPVSVGDVLE